MGNPKHIKWIEPDGLLIVEAWARDGLTNDQIAHNMGVTAKTLYEWKKKYCELSDALKKGKEVVDIQVENSLYKRAIGYTYEEIRTEREYGVVTKEVVTTKMVLPDTTAQIFWLKNRRPDRWRDKQDIEHSGAVNVHKVYDEMSEEELMELAKKYEKINSS